MRVLIAPDKFKGSLSGREVAEAIAAGIGDHDPAVETVIHPLADGGEGTLDTLEQVLPTQRIRVVVRDPLFREVEATYLLAGDKAFIEMANASGLQLLTEEERSATKTSSFGTGEQIKDAVDRGAREIYLTIGGSATNDLGMGVAHALGYRFLDQSSSELTPVGENMSKVAAIDTRAAPDLSEIKVQVICDVQNPLYGPYGAAFVYARQKGASPTDIEALDRGLRHLAAIIQRDLGADVSHLPGSGAAGGMGGGAVAFLGAQLMSGIDAVMEMTDFKAKVERADLIITGEGKVDEQTLQGKVVDGVRRMAVKHQKPFVVICGVNELSDRQLQDLGAVGVYVAKSPDMTIERAIADAGQLVRRLSQRMMVETME